MAQNRIQPGKTIPFANSSGSTILSGSPVIIGTKVGVALVDIPDGGTGSVALEEVWELPKLTGNAFNQGAECFLTPGGSITPTATGNTYAGFAFLPAVMSDTNIQVKINA